MKNNLFETEIDSHKPVWRERMKKIWEQVFRSLAKFFKQEFRMHKKKDGEKNQIEYKLLK